MVASECVLDEEEARDGVSETRELLAIHQFFGIHAKSLTTLCNSSTVL
jgi:hypothetical protein